ncbi:MAG: hypothetical protein QXY62_03270 [Candidatus Altiarchaeota archaeon]
MEKKHKRKKLTLIAVAILLLLSQIQQVSAVFESVWKELLIYPILRAKLAATLWFWIENRGSLFAKNFYELILFTPSPQDNPIIMNFMIMFIKLVQPLYLLAIVFTAFYLFFISASPKGRANAKTNLFMLMKSMFFVSISPLLLSLLLQFSRVMTGAAFNIVDKGIIQKILLGGIHGMYAIVTLLALAPEGIAGPWPYTILSFVAWMPYIFISIRNIVVTILEIIFPLTILLYSFRYTRGMARTVMEQTITWVLLQFFWALVLVALALSLSIKEKAFISNPTISNLSVPVFSSLQQIFSFVTSLVTLGFANTTIPEISTDIFTLVLGLTAYAMICALPFTLIGLIRGVLP